MDEVLVRGLGKHRERLVFSFFGKDSGITDQSGRLEPRDYENSWPGTCHRPSRRWSSVRLVGPAWMEPASKDGCTLRWFGACSARERIKCSPPARGDEVRFVPYSRTLK